MHYHAFMARLFSGKYRVDTTRLKNWDYGWNAEYFVTICTKNRVQWFGNVENKMMKLSQIGKIADRCWMEIPDHFPFVKLGAYVIMPDHVHGIIIIDKPNHNKTKKEAQDFAPLVQPLQKFGPQSRNLPSIIRGFKIGVKRNARLIRHRFEWQPRYYVHIIRNKRAYNRISKYIVDNPANWGKK